MKILLAYVIPLFFPFCLVRFLHFPLKIEVRFIQYSEVKAVVVIGAASEEMFCQKRFPLYARHSLHSNYEMILLL